MPSRGWLRSDIFIGAIDISAGFERTDARLQTSDCWRTDDQSKPTLTRPLDA